MLLPKSKELVQRAKRSRFRSCLLAASSLLSTPWIATTHAQNGGYIPGNYPAQNGVYAPQVSNPGYAPGSYPPSNIPAQIPSYPPAPVGQPVYGQPGYGQPLPVQPQPQSPVYDPMPAIAPTPPSTNAFGTTTPSAPAWPLDPTLFPDQAVANRYQPRVRDVPVDVYVTEGQTGRFMLGGSVNSDLGVMGNITIEERNFDIMNFPRRRGDLFNGAFRGAGQNFRLEIVPGNQVQRYTVNWTEPNLFGYSPFSLSVGGFLFSRYYRDWKEERLGGRAMIGYEINPNLSISTELRAEDVDIENPRVLGVPKLDRSLGSNDLYTGRVSLIHSTRNSPFLPTEGHYLELIYDQGFGEYDFPRGQVNYSRYFLIRERADGTGRQTLTSSHKLGFSGADTPIFENFFAGGFSTLRGFRFRGASPVESDVQVGGRFQFIGSLEYMFPVTADDMVRMVTFIDYGTIEQDIEFDWKNFRAAPGLGLRIAVPAMGPAPLAFDFAFPILDAAGDQRQIFNFSMGVTR
jgi:outer membrane protein insertion porin family